MCPDTLRKSSHCLTMFRAIRYFQPSALRNTFVERTTRSRSTSLRRDQSSRERGKGILSQCVNIPLPLSLEAIKHGEVVALHRCVMDHYMTNKTFSLPDLLLLLGLCALNACGIDAPDQTPSTPASEPPIQESPVMMSHHTQSAPVLAQGNLPWFEDLLFLVDGTTRPSWLFELKEEDDVTFTLTGQGQAVDVNIQLNRWDTTEWSETSWVQTRADDDQRVVITRTLEPGYYWLVVSTPEDHSTPLPFSIFAECASNACMTTKLDLAPQAPQDIPFLLPEVLEPEAPGVHLTRDFRDWLGLNGYAEDDFVREDLPGASFGGRLSPQQDLMEQPVVFIHGNGDRAFGGPLGGWSASIEAFLEEGYTSAELYALTWGDANPIRSASQYHSAQNLRRIRRFLEAVLAYTRADRVDVITHSMGVTLARRAILGGRYEDELSGEVVDLGEPLTSRIDAFVGISGANRGLLACGLTGPGTPTCDDEHGLFPGMYLGRAGRSTLLSTLDETPGHEGAFVASIWSRSDELLNSIGLGTIIWGVPTAQIPEQDAELVLNLATHLQSRDRTTDAQLSLVRDRELEP